MDLPEGALQPLLRRAAWAVIATQAASQVVSLAVLAVLFRLLGPTPYGVVGMVMPLLLFFRLLAAAGLDVAAVQQARLDPRQASGLFWLNQLFGLVAAAVAVAAAPVLAWFYGTAAVLPVAAAMAGTLVVTALGVQHAALLQRRMRLDLLAGLRFCAHCVAGGAAIAAAAAGWGVWSLVVQQYVELGMVTLLVWFAEPWRPGRPVGGVGLRRLVRFGGHYTLSNLMFYVTTNVDKVVVGFALGETALGLYSQAFNLVMKPLHVLLTPLTGVMLPALSRLALEPAEYRRLLTGFFRLIALGMLPCGVGLALVAREAILVLGGPQWEPAGPILGVLAAALLVQGFFNAFGSVFASAGRVDRLAAASVVIAATLTVAFVVGLVVGQWAGWPLLGVAGAYSATMLVVIFPPYLVYCLRSVGYPLRGFFAAAAPAAAATAVMAMAVLAWRLAMPPTSPGRLLAGQVAVGLVVFAAAARAELRELYALLRNR